MGANWQEFERKKKIYPNLEYIPSRSAHPREAHRALWGTIRPIDDPFWDVYMPPSAWNCKCSVRATRKHPNNIPDDTPAVPPDFRFNPGKTAQTFRTEEHPYRKNTDKKTAVEVGKWYDKQYESELRALYKEKYGSDWKRGYKLAETIGIPKNYSLDKKLNYIAGRIKDAPNELGFALNTEGKVIGRYTGTGSMIAADLPKNSIFMHNHPKGNHLSYPDLINASRYNVAEISAVGKDKKYTIKKPEKGWPKVNDIADEIMRLEDKAFEVMEPAEYIEYRSHGITLDVFKLFNINQIISKL